MSGLNVGNDLAGSNEEKNRSEKKRSSYQTKISNANKNCSTAGDPPARQG